MKAQDISLRMHKSLPQSRAMMPQNQVADSSVFISLPSAVFHIGNSGFSYNDLVQSDGDSAFLDFESMIDGLGKNNFINASAALNFISLGKRWDRFQLSLNHAQKLKLYFRYTDEMARFIWYGNSRFIGQTVNLAPDFEALNYFETALNTSYKFDRLNIGFSLKYLNGQAVIYGNGNALNFTTDANTFNLNLNADFQVNTHHDSAIAKIRMFPNKWGANPGWGVDLGASFDVTSKWQISVSLIDIGRIYWNDEPKTYSLNQSISFEGLDLSSYLLGDSFNIQKFQDSLAQFTDLKENQDPFQTNLIPRMYLASSYQLNEQWNIGAIVQMQAINWKNPHTVVSLSAVRNLGFKQHFFEPGIHYTYRNRSPFGLGLSMLYEWKNLQVYVGGDNVFSWFLPKAKVPLSLFDKRNEDAIIIPKSLKTLNGRFGINLLLNSRNKSRRAAIVK
ncbi:MAG: DUF5723 family protein [Salibacteraceae bacterium]